MIEKKNMKPLTVALGTAVTATLASIPAAQAGDNPFGMSKLSEGYMVAAEEGKCGEGKCGSNAKKQKMEEGKCGAKSEEKKTEEGKCGAKPEEKKTEEGKCGGNK